MEPVFEHCNIKVYDVSILQRASIRDAVANDLVHRGAATARESVIVKRGGIPVVFNDEFVNDTVDLLCGHTNSNRLVAEVQGFSRYLGAVSNELDLLWSVSGYNLISNLLFLDIWVARISVIGFLDVVWNPSPASEGIRERSHGS